MSLSDVERQDEFVEEMLTDNDIDNESWQPKHNWYSEKKKKWKDSQRVRRQAGYIYTDKAFEKIMLRYRKNNEGLLEERYFVWGVNESGYPFYENTLIANLPHKKIRYRSFRRNYDMDNYRNSRKIRKSRELQNILNEVQEYYQNKED